MDTYRVKLTLIKPMLGTVSKDKDVYKTHILTKAAGQGDEDAAEELSKVPNVEDRGWTGFLAQEDGTPVIKHHMIRGFLKNACGMLRKVKSSLSSSVTAYKKVIDGMVFVDPWYIPLVLPKGEVVKMLEIDFKDGGLAECERSLRASTPQGDRIALARSDAAPIGTTLEFEVKVLGVVTEELLHELWQYGAYVGLGQWRGSGGYGRFTYEMTKVDV